MSEREYIVTSPEEEIRIDKLLSRLNRGYTRSQVKTWFKQDLIRVNGKAVKPNYTCQIEDKIEWDFPDEKAVEIQPKDIPLDILYEDQDIMIINKQSGLVVHPAAGHQDDTLVSALLYHSNELSTINGSSRPGIVHRIDKDTSGLLVIAKHDTAHKRLAEQLKERKIKRLYKAIVHGDIPHDYGTIDAPIGRSGNNRQLMAVVENGKAAKTHFEVIERLNGKYSYIQCSLETGRTHQIRVHMKYIGYPIVGDPKYGQRKSEDVNGQALHAFRLELEHPITGKWLTFEAPLPRKFAEILEIIRKSY